jgi:hypothetical protein
MPTYSTNRDYQSSDLLEELARRRLVQLAGHAATHPTPFSQSVDADIASWDLRNGLWRDRMSALRALELDAPQLIAHRQFVRLPLRYSDCPQ